MGPPHTPVHVRPRRPWCGRGVLLSACPRTLLQAGIAPRGLLQAQSLVLPGAPGALGGPRAQ